MCASQALQYGGVTGKQLLGSLQPIRAFLSPLQLEQVQADSTHALGVLRMQPHLPARVIQILVDTIPVIKLCTGRIRAGFIT